MTVESLVHVMLVSFPGQGHVNPLLRLGKLIASKGFLVTFVTTELWGRKMRRGNKIVDGELIPVGKGFVRFEFFDDEWSDDDERRTDFAFFLPQLELVGRRVITRLVKSYQDKDQPVSCLVNNPFIPWVCDVAGDLRIASAVLWVQSCACFAAYYHYHHRLSLFPTETEPEIDVQLPYMPLLKHDEIPSYLHPSSPFSGFRDAILKQFANLDKPFCVLIESFDALEHELIDYMSKLCPIKAIGPLFKIAGTVNSNVSGDICKPSDNIVEWLDSRPASSVVYISFGTAAYLKQEQINEIAFGVLDADVSFLWVVRPPPDEAKVETHVLPQELKHQSSDKGKIVEWCPQDEVLQHPSVGCFLTHCGWNSTMEAITSGIPVICFPQWGDQVTNAAYLVDVFKTGVRLCRGAAGDRIVPREEVSEKLTEAMVGTKAEELRRNGIRWKEAAVAAVDKGGSSDKNFNEFVDRLSYNVIHSNSY
ncbi:PREDICTED: UDP-glycosyltransferase 84A1-like [Tarenaya hassleriana]|uniref:UDP-glycosyltransferase 84A1-like n=1 Tax=Tarenaya hassleriana TaxID=28532 RepID=UPI00053C0B91|nr:PREDICTED: UDP-glycosyltransferase 84A1-like [Tarenaya hassleriana]